MEVSNAKRIVCQVASGLGILQSIAWALMAIVAISVYFSQPEMESLENIKSYACLVSQLIFSRFFIKLEDDISEDSLYKNMIIRPNAFHIFMWIYLFINLAWLSNSGFLFFVSRNGAANRLKSKINFWVWNTLAISLLDFIFVCLLARDYDHCPFNPKNENGVAVGVACYLPTGIVLTLAAKGFVLWFINLGLAFLTQYFSNKIVIPKPAIINDVNNGPLYPSIPRIPERRIPPPNVSPYPNPELNQGQFNRNGQQPILPQQQSFRNNNPHNFY